MAAEEGGLGAAEEGGLEADGDAGALQHLAPRACIRGPERGAFPSGLGDEGDEELGDEDGADGLGGSDRAGGSGEHCEGARRPGA